MRRFPIRFFSPVRWARLGRFRGDARGVAAIEFAMVAPLMMAMFFGAVEFSQVLTVDRRVSQVASTTADLIARTKTMTTADMTGVMEVVGELLKPYETGPLRMTVLSVAADIDDVTDTRVCWAHDHANGGTGTYAKNSSYPLPLGVVEPGDSVIVAEVRYNYDPLIFSVYLPTGKTLEDRYYLKPRLSSYVEFAGQDCS